MLSEQPRCRGCIFCGGGALARVGGRGGLLKHLGAGNEAIKGGRGKARGKLTREGLCESFEVEGNTFNDMSAISNARLQGG